MKRLTSPPHFMPRSSPGDGTAGSGSAASPAVVSANRRIPDPPPPRSSWTASNRTLASSGPPPAAPPRRTARRRCAARRARPHPWRRSRFGLHEESLQWLGTSILRQSRSPGYAPPVQTTPVAVVCDFDGTATLLDIGDEISKHFGGAAHWEAESARFRRGELGTRGIIQAIYTEVFASEDEVRAFAAREARLRPGFSELIAACRSTSRRSSRRTFRRSCALTSGSSPTRASSAPAASG